ncbi:MAG: FAD-binding protein [Clostridia bacterium]|nr:FAD-binding protein [Clostridia bacterium]
MKNKNIVVLLKYFKSELNAFDGSALECALELGATNITALTMAPPSALASFQSLTRLGVKCVMVSDSSYAGSDTIATSYILSEAIKRLNPDLIFCGRQSIDGDTSQVPPMLAQRLGFEIKTKAIEFNSNKITLRNGESFLPNDKTIITFEKIRTLRFPSIFSKLDSVTVWDNKILSLPLEKCGIEGSPTRVVKSYESSVGRRECKFVKETEFSSIINNALQKDKINKINETNEKLSEVYYVGNVKKIAESVGINAIEIIVKDKKLEEIAKETKSKTVLWEDSEELKILASKVAVLVNAGICADCISFSVKNQKLIMTRPALSGSITADIVCESETTFAIVRTVKNEKSEIIFSVGKGAIEYIDKINALAQKYGAEVCCSRIVADSGKLPYEKQVGLTGRSVSPKVYVAFGISGAVQHTCAISGAGTVIAINKNKDERIFDYADYGIVADINNLV